MKRLLLVVLLSVVAISSWAVISWQQSYRPPSVDLVTHYPVQDRQVTGKVGVLFTGLMMPESLDDIPDLFLRLSMKPKREWPWPFSLLVQKSHPVVLLDAKRFHAREPFEPTRLVDAWGSDVDANGVSYTEKFKAGEISWVPPKDRLASGHFLDNTVTSDWPTFAQKPTVNARLWYYGVGLEPQGMPHEAGVWEVVDMATATLQARYPDMVIRHVNAPVAEDVRQAVFALLDSGVDTLILASTQVAHSTYKVLGKGGSFHEAWRYAEEWQRRNGNPPLKIIMADPMGHYQPMADAFAQLLKERLDTLPPGTDVDVLLSSHGMPWDRFPDETYPGFAKPYYDGLKRAVSALLENYDFGRTRITQGQDIYADDYYDPDNRYVSTNEAYRAAAADGYDTIITLPTTFYAESTDTLFGHAIYAFEGLPGFDPFATIQHEDWREPFVREFQLGDTLVVYNGLPVGRFAPYVAQSLADSVIALME